MNKEKTRVPLIHISRRAALPWYKAWAIRAAAIILALVVCGVLTMLLTGQDSVREVILFPTMKPIGGKDQ